MRISLNLPVIFLIVWIMMIMGFFLIDQFYKILLIFEIQFGSTVINIIMVSIGVIMTISWLSIWRKLAILYYRRNLMK
ncbi:MAG: hypothetical protein NWF08_04855 [Candidatus Bathyarchaeota archaeon]|nr:hypothetical protein [Candidatus Bathyarchaeota archaeon]